VKTYIHDQRTWSFRGGCRCLRFYIREPDNARRSARNELVSRMGKVLVYSLFSTGTRGMRPIQTRTRRQSSTSSRSGRNPIATGSCGSTFRRPVRPLSPDFIDFHCFRSWTRVRRGDFVSGCNRATVINLGLIAVSDPFRTTSANR
jgi:hypothetical protein